MFDEDDSSIPPAEEKAPPSLLRKWWKRETLEKIRRCQKCKKQVLASEERCAYCGVLMDTESPAWTIVTVVLVVIFIVVFLIRLVL